MSSYILVHRKDVDKLWWNDLVNAELMEELLEIPKNAKQCRECRKFFVPTHRNSLYCPICREKIAAEKARKRSQKYRDQKKVNRHDC